jgi:hypothetical protein
MTTREKISEFLDTLPGMFLLGFMMALLVSEAFTNGRGSWQHLIVRATLFAIFFTFSTRNNLAKRGAKFNLSNSAQLRMLSRAISTGKLSADKEVVAALPAFIDERMKWYETQRMKFTIIMLAILAIIEVIGVVNRNIALIILATLLFGATLQTYFKTAKLPEQVEALRKQL